MPTIQVASFGGVSALPIRVAQSQGGFERAGISVDERLTRSSQELREQLLDGTIAIAQLAPDNVVAWVDAGAPLKAWLGGSNGPIALVGMDAGTIPELQGKRIGVDSPSSGFVTILAGLLGAHGLSLADTELVPLGATRLRYRALLAGDVSATMLTQPWARLAERQRGRVLGDHRNVAPGLITSCAASMTRFLAEQPEAASAYGEALGWAVGWLRETANQPLAAELLATELEIDRETARDVVVAMMDAEVGWPTSLALSERSLLPSLTLRAQTLGLAAQEPETYVDTLIASGGMP
jgi:NitT/TauT family transport system substrate-binding protein